NWRRRCPATFLIKVFLPKTTSGRPLTNSSTKRGCVHGASTPNIEPRRKKLGKSTIPNTACRCATWCANPNSSLMSWCRPSVIAPYVCPFSPSRGRDHDCARTRGREFRRQSGTPGPNSSNNLYTAGRQNRDSTKGRHLPPLTHL